jgi:hypothetical protein
MKASTLLLVAVAVLALAGGAALVKALPPGTVPDIVQVFSNAIATAEGFFINGSRAQRNNNPGNIEAGGQFVVYGSTSDGWAALYHQVYLMFFGGSAIYNPAMTIAQVAYQYADGAHDPTGAANWAANVAAAMGVTTDTTLQTLIQGA